MGRRSKRAAQSEIIPVVRDLVRTYQKFIALDTANLRTLGITPPQFDVVATLGNTEGLGMRQLSEKTLITKGTLTGVVDRLVRSGLVERQENPADRRCFMVRLTKTGEQCFERIFPAHIEYLAERFSALSAKDRQWIRAALSRLQEVIE